MCELRDVEEDEAHARVLGYGAGHDLRLGHRHVERVPHHLGERGEHEDPERDRAEGERPDGERDGFCASTIAGERQAAGEHGDRRRRRGRPAARRR